jgi:hypothetical protein
MLMFKRLLNEYTILKSIKTLRTPFWTFNSGTRYSFINAGKTVKGAQVSATIAIKINLRVSKKTYIYKYRKLIMNIVSIYL